MTNQQAIENLIHEGFTQEETEELLTAVNYFKFRYSSLVKGVRRHALDDFKDSAKHFVRDGLSFTKVRDQERERFLGKFLELADIVMKDINAQHRA